MKVEIRKTVAGTEYWDTEEKRTLFVPVGEEADFEVTENPESMLKEEGVFKREVLGEWVSLDLSKMKVEQLRAYAAEHGIDIPDDVKKKDDIVAFLS